MELYSSWTKSTQCGWSWSSSKFQNFWKMKSLMTDFPKTQPVHDYHEKWCFRNIRTNRSLWGGGIRPKPVLKPGSSSKFPNLAKWNRHDEWSGINFQAHSAIVPIGLRNAIRKQANLNQNLLVLTQYSWKLTEWLLRGKNIDFHRSLSQCALHGGMKANKILKIFCT